MVQTVGRDIFENLVGITRLTTYDDQCQVFGQVCQCLHSQKDVLTPFDGSHVEDEAFGEAIEQADRFVRVYSGRIVETRGTALVDDRDTVFIDTTIFHDVTFRTLTDSDDMIRLPDGLTELPRIDLRVYPVVELRMAEEDQVVDGHHTLDASPADAYWQFTRETVIHLYPVLFQILHDATTAPDGLVEGQVTILGIAEHQTGGRDDLFTQVVTSLVGSIESEAEGRVQTGDVVDEGSSVTAETCGIAHDALGVISYNHILTVCGRRNGPGRSSWGQRWRAQREGPVHD